MSNDECLTRSCGVADKRDTLKFELQISRHCYRILRTTHTRGNIPNYHPMHNMFLLADQFIDGIDGSPDRNGMGAQ
ncbi:hypothetical protein JAAARDRAFT_639352 [Jaapia argillacea MUCL 33604]|uniref:Uncharacterized protein n=1 Tax=Jaapia argillacea MUCL 33604 TaxID=933084 RepID=A0A067PEW8_9AGAM|nr:hypothetical protein JAAARDRAFT_639352 [Jaapia argillacea MUCL 33604]